MASLRIACALRLPAPAGPASSTSSRPPAAQAWQQPQQRVPLRRRAWAAAVAAAPSAAGGVPSLLDDQQAADEHEAAAEAAAAAALPLVDESTGEELMDSYSDEEEEEAPGTLTLVSKPERQQRRRPGGAGSASGWDGIAPRPHSGPVTLAGKRYDSLQAVREEMRVLQRQLLPEGETEVAVPPESPHFETILAVFQQHPNYRQKVREPVASFFVVRNPHVSSGQGCEFQYTDARGPAFRDDFSLLKCTRPKPRLRRRNLLLEACSRAVEEQVAAAGEAACGEDGARHCARCGEDFKVDILYTGLPLSKLVQQYVASGGAATRAPLKFAKPSGGSQLAAFRQKNEAWQRGWQEYHAQHAQLEPVCKHCASHRERQAGSLHPIQPRRGKAARGAQQREAQQEQGLPVQDPQDP